MIKNQNQLNITKVRLSELIEAKNQFQTQKGIQYCGNCGYTEISNDNQLKYKLVEESFNGLIEDLENQINEYEDLIKGNFHIESKGIENIPNILIATRIAKKLSQKELAEKLNINEEQIKHYESTDYEDASWTRIVEIILALDIRISFEKIIIE